MIEPIKPLNPSFSSGPTAKFKGWSLSELNNSLIGRSHRSSDGKLKLKKCIEETKQLLKLPNDFLLGILPGSNTGAFEIALWNSLGIKDIDVLVWDSFGNDWANDISEQLKLTNLNIIKEEYGSLPDLNKVNFQNDVVFTWNGTTSGVCLPNADWIPYNRQGLTICDATSAVFAYEIDWTKIDILTFSWQKALGGEGAHGMLVLSPKAVKRINNYEPKWPMPKLFNLKKDGKLNLQIFNGLTINTPSLLLVEDWLSIIKWAISNGGMDFLKQKTQENYEVFKKFCSENMWIDFLAENEIYRSKTSVCLKIIDPWFCSLEKNEQEKKMENLISYLEENNVAFDIKSYRTAPLGLRIWCGPTVEKLDLEYLTKWLQFGWESIYKK